MIELVQTSASSVRVRWIPQSSGAPVTGYRIHYTGDDGNTETESVGSLLRSLSSHMVGPTPSQ